MTDNAHSGSDDETNNPAGHVRAFQTATTDGTALVLTDADSRDAAQLSGRWIKTADTVEVRQ